MIGNSNTIFSGYQRFDNGLTNLSRLTIGGGGGGFVKMTDIDTFTLGTIAETKTDLGVDLNTIHSGSDGSDHSKVTANETVIGLNTIHRSSDGSDHSKVNTNESAIAAIPVIPTGALLMWATDTTPDGWLLCYGQAVSRTTYPDLFTVIGTIFGVGDGSTTFNLPDLRGRLPLGKDNMGGASADRVTHANADSIGGVEGAESHALTEAELATHRHGLQARNIATTGTDPTNHKIGGGKSGYGIWSSGIANVATHAENITNTGSGNAHTSMQPYITINYIIKE